MVRERKVETGRRKRNHFGTQRLKMDIDPETKRRLKAEGKVPVWINDTGSRLNDALDGDYTFEHAEEVGNNKEAREQEDTRRMLRVGTRKHGEPLNAYLMSIPEEYYAEDQAIKEEENVAVDRAIKGGEPKGPLDVNPDLGSTTAKVHYNP